MTAPQGDPGVMVTLDSIYKTLLEMKFTLDRVAGEQVNQGKDIADHESRLRSLERGRWPVTSLNILISLGALVLAFLATRH